jgi:hypothetical protein
MSSSRPAAGHAALWAPACASCGHGMQLVTGPAGMALATEHMQIERALMNLLNAYEQQHLQSALGI